MDQVARTVRSHENSYPPSNSICLVALRLQDYKYMTDYNSTFFEIVTRLKLCGMKIIEVEMLEKAFFTFHASNSYYNSNIDSANFLKYSKLISMLLIAEQTNELLLKNHDLRLTDSIVVPKAHASSNKSFDHSRDRG